MKLTGSVFLLSLTIVGSILSSQAYAAGVDATAEELANRVAQAKVEVPKATTQSDWRERADAVAKNGGALLEKTCKDVSYITIANKYAVSVENTTKQPCRLYDLSFPTLKSWVASMKYSSLPTQKFTSRDYLDWVNGNFQSIQNRMKSYEGLYGNTPMNALDEDQVGTADWVTQIKFRRPEMQNMPMSFGVATLPRTFHASDLAIGDKFKFSALDVQRLRALVRLLAISGTPIEIVKSWSETAERPESLLEKIRFDWNDVKKVYDIALEGEFLPISGPVALIDYRTPYKPAVERMIRSILGSAVLNLVNFIPDPRIQNIVYFVVEDAMMFIENAYTYQNNQLEFALKASAPMIAGVVDAKFLTTSLNLMYASQGDLMTIYVNSLVKGEKFDWMKMDQIGKKARYQAEKGRQIMMDRTNNRLVQKSGCKAEIVYDYFATCSKAGRQSPTLYSLLTEQNILFWNMGAAQIYNYNSPYEVTIKRGLSYVLSVGLRLVKLPISASITYRLAGIMKSYSFAGTDDEAFLRSSLAMEKQAGTITPANEKLLNSLYTFSMNPFLPHSMKGENSYVEANKGILKMNSNNTTALQTAVGLN